MTLPHQSEHSGTRVNFYVAFDHNVLNPIVEKEKVTIYPLTSAIDFTSSLENLQPVGQYKIVGRLKVNKWERSDVYAIIYHII